MRVAVLVSLRMQQSAAAAQRLQHGRAACIKHWLPGKRRRLLGRGGVCAAFVHLRTGRFWCLP